MMVRRVGSLSFVQFVQEADCSVGGTVCCVTRIVKPCSGVFDVLAWEMFYNTVACFICYFNHLQVIRLSW